MAKPNSIGFATPVAMDPANQRVLMDNESLGTKFWLDPPFGPVGTTIPLPETWAVSSCRDTPCEGSHDSAKYVFKADGDDNCSGTWRSPALAPADAIRLHIEVVGVRYERLSEMTEDALIKEGIIRNTDTSGAVCYTAPSIDDKFITPADAYLALWRQSNGPQSLTRDPWIWVTEFRVSSDEAPTKLVTQPTSPKANELHTCS